MATFFTGLLYILIVLCSLFLICLVLIQRGKGGGLAGAFGGMGGSSAFGTKAGDVFTKVTIITAGIWFALAMILVLLVNNTGRTSAYDLNPSRSASEIPAPGGAPAGTKNLNPSGTPSSPAPSPAGTPPPTTKLPTPPPLGGGEPIGSDTANP